MSTDTPARFASALPTSSPDRRPAAPPPRIAVVGAGYVGLVTAAAFAAHGVLVDLLDVDADRVQRLRRGESVLHEPGLADLVAAGIASGRLCVGTDLAAVLHRVEVVFVAVATPSTADGRADLGAVARVAQQVAEQATGPVLLVTKSTVPVGTAGMLADLVDATLARRGVRFRIDVAANPEFLREGRAVADALRPARIVIGTRTASAAALLHRLYAPHVAAGTPLIDLDVRTAELAKYAANAALAVRVSMVNLFAQLCEATGADVVGVQQVLGSDPRIGPAFLRPGVGFGGSCFPKDLAALEHTGRDHGVDMALLEATVAVNDERRHLPVRLLQQRLPLAGARIAVWGLAFKPDTDDTREAPSVTVIEDLLAAGAQVVVHDPEAATPPALAERVMRAADPVAAVTDADALVLVTEWSDYLQVSAAAVARAMPGRLVVDGRNVLDPAAYAAVGLQVLQVGRPHADGSWDTCAAELATAARRPAHTHRVPAVAGRAGSAA